MSGKSDRVNRSKRIQQISMEVRFLLAEIEEAPSAKEAIASCSSNMAIVAEKAELLRDLTHFCSNFGGPTSMYGGALPLHSKALPGVEYVLVQASHRWRRKDWVQPKLNTFTKLRLSESINSMNSKS